MGARGRRGRKYETSELRGVGASKCIEGDGRWVSECQKKGHKCWAESRSKSGQEPRELCEQVTLGTHRG